MRIRAVTIGVALSALVGTSVLATTADARRARIQTGPDAEITHDGLHRVDRTTADRVWVKPDIDLSIYNKMILVGAPMSFREVEQPRNQTTRSRGRNRATEFPISEEDRERIEEIFAEQFRNELSRVERFEITDTPGPDTMILVGTAIDVVSSIPPPAVGRSEVFLSSVGEATLILQIHDSETNEILLRAADRREASPAFGMVHSNTAQAWSEVTRLAQSWASLLRRRLDQVSEFVAETSVEETTVEEAEE